MPQALACQLAPAEAGLEARQGGEDFEEQLDWALGQIRSMLLAKNAAYGNSALDPVRVFARSDAVEQIRVRLDDKISRMVRGRQFADENTEDDLLGYLVLLRIAKRQAI